MNMSMIWTRRQTLKAAGATAALLGTGRSWAASKTLNILSHRVHQACLTEGPAGDQLGNWRKAQDAEAVYATFDSNPLQDRLFREASLASTDFGVGYLVSSRATPSAAKLLLPLDDYMAKAPIESFSDIAAGMVAGMRFDGKLASVPVRHATTALFYNEALLEERGIKAPPKSLEELVDQCKRCTFTSAAGTQVTGMILASDLSEFPVTFARAYGGDFIGPDLKLLPDPGAMEKALATLQDMFKAGALPRSYATTKNDDQVTWMQQGRAAFTVITFARNTQLNKAGDSKYPGKIKAIEFPASEALVKANIPMSSVTAVWGMSILANAKDKDLAWSYIREVSSRAVTTGAARNGNGPVRASTYADPGFAKDQPFAAVEARVLAHARIPLPAFPEAARAQTLFLVEVQLCVIGQKTPKAAVEAIRERCAPLVKA
jgi:multiple sugar transport system substrate-binding protein